MPVSGTRLVVLCRRAEFLAVAAHGKKWITPGLVVQIKPQATPQAQSAPTPEISGYGLTASRKVGNAVARNRARRRMRALANECLPRHAKPAHDYVLIARAATVTRDHADLKKDLLWALRKLG